MKKLILVTAVLASSVLSFAQDTRQQDVDLSSGAKPKQIRIEDSSDWWSAIRDDGALLRVEKEIKSFPSAATFVVAGIPIREDDWELLVRKKFGPTTEVDRGDASTGREQWCYRSQAGTEVLVFEAGEVTIGFYLLSRPASWNGDQYCRTVKGLDDFMHSASGLHLGMSPQETIELLGKPAKRQRDYFLYSFQSRRKTTPSERKLLREGQNMSDEEFERNFAYIDLTATINVKFTNGKATLIYVADTDTL